MTQRFTLKANRKEIPVIALLFVASFKWFFAGIASTNTIQFAFLFAGLLCLLTYKKVRISRQGCIWILYLVAVFLSIATHTITPRIISNAIPILLITLYVVLIDQEICYYKRGVSYLLKMGIIHSILVVLHLLLRERFNAFYFQFLKPSALDFAKKYYAQGHFYGVFFTPADAAGLIAFAVVALLLWSVLYKRKQSIRITIAMLLFLPLLLTGKRGLLFCMVIAYALVMIIIYDTKKQRYRIIMLLSGILFGYVILRYLIATNPDTALFYRFGQLFTNLSSGDEFDSGRSVLYAYAIKYWNENQLLGIGWRAFSDRTVSELGYVRTHEVNCDYIQFLCETGIVGFVLIMIPIVTMLWRTIFVSRRIVKGITDMADRWVILFAIFVQFFIVMYAVVEVPFYDMFFYSVYIFSCIIINSTYKRMASCDAHSCNSNARSQKKKHIEMLHHIRIHRRRCR